MKMEFENKALRHRKRLWLMKLRFALIFIAVLAIGICSKSICVTDSQASVKASKDRSSNSEKVIITDKIKSKKIQTIEENLTEYLDNFKGVYGIYYYNLATGEKFGINHKEVFTAASTIKIPLNLYLYKQIKSGVIDPQDKLTYLQEDYEGGTGDIRYESIGNRYEIKELSRLSIVSSDNVASNMLKRLLGMSNVKQYMRELGGSIVDEDKNISCPQDMGIYMKEVYDFYTQDKAAGNGLMESLLNTEFNDRIPALLPKGVKVAHKIGTQVEVVNDVGIIFAQNPYILSVMSKDVDEDEAPKVLARISEKVYNYANQK